MAVKVTLKNFRTESFDGEDDEYRFRNGALEVSNGQGEVLKFYVKGFWVAVEGKQKRGSV